MEYYQDDDEGILLDGPRCCKRTPLGQVRPDREL